MLQALGMTPPSTELQNIHDVAHSKQIIKEIIYVSDDTTDRSEKKTSVWCGHLNGSDENR